MRPVLNLAKLWRLAVSTILSASVLAIEAPSRAADWPDRPVTILVPYAPGGNTDSLGRLLAAQMTKRFGVPVLVDNEGGAAGEIGTSRVSRAKPDGYALLLASVSQIVIIPGLKKANYDPDASLTPISIFGTGPFILGVRADLPVKNLQELIAYGRANPGKLTYATAGLNGTSHLAAAYFAASAQIKMTPVAYKGGNPAAQAVAAGEVDMYFGAGSDLQSFSQTGRLRMLGVTLNEPSATYPEVQTINSVMPGFAFSSWNGLFAPAGTPPEIIAKLQDAVQTAAREPSVVKSLAGMGVQPVGDTSEHFKSTIASDRLFFTRAIQAADLDP